MATGSYPKNYGATTNHWRAWQQVSYNANDTQCVYTVKGGFASVGWGFSLSGVTATISCTGKTSGNRSGNVSIGSGQSVDVQLGADATFTFARTKTPQNIVISTRVNNSTGYMNGTSTASFSTVVNALPSYPVTYNANGGTGAPGAQTKWHGEALSLSGVRPTRAGHEFVGWATSASATSAAYQPGASYAGNAALSLYAVWRLAYAKPTISGLSAHRCDSGGSATEDGTYIRVSCSWAVDTTYNASNKASGVEVEWRPAGGATWTQASNSNPNAASGTLALTIGAGGADPSTSYDVRVTVTDSGGSASAETVVSPSFVTLDLKAGGRGIAFGQAATADGFACAMDATFTGELTTSRPLVVTKDIPVNATSATVFSAGTPGTRGAQFVLESLARTGYRLIGLAIVSIEASQNANFQAFAYNGTLYVNLYRATASAYTVEAGTSLATVRAVWAAEGIAGNG